MQRGFNWVALLAVIALCGCTRTIATSIPVGSSASSLSPALSQAISDGDIRGVYALPQTRLRVALMLTDDETRGVFVLTGEKPDNVDGDVFDVPDPKHVYALQHNASFWADDSIVLRTDAKSNLLKSITTTATDRTIDVAELAATAILRGVTGIPTVTVGEQSDGGRSGGGSGAIVYSTDLDPTDPAAVARVNDSIKALCARLVVHTPPVSSKPALAPTAQPSGTPGILFRAKIPYLIEYVEEAATDARCSRLGTQERTVASKFILSGSRSEPVSLSLERAYFVQISQDYVFGDKRDTSRVVKKSEALALAQVPLDVVDAILSIPVEAVKQLLNQSTEERKAFAAQKAAYEQEIAAIDARIKVIKAQKELEEALKKKPGPEK